MPKNNHFVTNGKAETRAVHPALLAVIENALRNNPAAAHAFATLMWMIGEAHKNPKQGPLVTIIVKDSIDLAYIYTSDHRADHNAGLEKFRRVLGDDCVVR